MGVRDEQLYAGFTEVVCGECRVRVLVRKMSAQQTSVQWISAADCAAGCPALRDSIRAAVEAGVLPPGPA